MAQIERGSSRGGGGGRTKPQGKTRRGRISFIAACLVAVALAGSSAIMWYAYNQGRAPSGEAVVPLIRAERGPIKVRPEQPGGMEVPHQDKLVYERLEPATDTPRVERLLPPPETPVALPSRPPETPEPAAEAEAGSGAKAQAAPVTRDEIAPPPPVEEVVAPVRKSGAAGPGYRVQLGAFSTDEGARQEWQRMRRRYGDLLGDLAVTVVRADVANKGVFHRLQAGPLGDEVAARNLCATLRARDVGCLIVRP